MSDFELNAAAISIREVSFGKKKLTKTLFTQIGFADCMNSVMDFTGDTVLGFVRLNGKRYLLWTQDGRLKRTSLSRYAALEHNVQWASLSESGWFLEKTGLATEAEADDEERLSRALAYGDQERYTALVEKAKAFLRSLEDKQIYL